MEARIALAATPYLHPVETPFEVGTGAFIGGQSSAAVDAAGDSIVDYQGTTGFVVSRANAHGQPLGTITVPSTAYASIVAADSAGDFVVAFAVASGQQSANLFLQLYDSTGTAQGAAIEVGMISGAPGAFDVAMDPTGNIVASWIDTQSTDVEAERYSAAGTPIGSSFVVSTATSASYVVAAAGPAGFVVGWLDSPSGLSNDLKIVPYNASGQALSSPITVASNVAPVTNMPPSVSVDSSGNYLIAEYQSGQQNVGTFAQRFSPAGAALDSPFEIVAGVPASVAMDGNSDVLATWFDGSSDYAKQNGPLLVAEHFNAQDQAVVGPFLVALPETKPAVVAASATGYFTLAWNQISQDGSTAVEQGQTFLASAANQAPQGTTITDQSAQATAVFTFNVAPYFSDADNDALSFSGTQGDGSALPTWLQVNQFGQVSAVPPASAIGNSYQVKVTATDQNGASTSETFGFTVTADLSGRVGAPYAIAGTTIASDGQGNLVAAWIDSSGDVLEQRYAADGTPQGSVTTVYTFDGTSRAQTVHVARTSAGNFAVLYTTGYYTTHGYPDPGQIFTPTGAFVDFYDAQGNALGTETVALPTPGDDGTSIAADGRNHFVVAFASSSGIAAEQFDEFGNLLGDVIAVSTDNGIDPWVADNASGNFVIAWTTGDVANNGYIDYVRQFDFSGGAQSAAITIADHALAPQVAEDSAGDFMVAWLSAPGFSNAVQGGPTYPVAQIYNIQGATQSPQLSLPGNPFGIAANPAGGFVVAAQSSNYGEVVERVDNQGNPQGPLYVLDPSTIVAPAPVVATDANGNFTVAWAHEVQGSSPMLEAERFEPNPILSAPLSLFIDLNTPVVFSAQDNNAITVAPSAVGGPLTVTLQVTSGTLTLGSTTTGASVSGNGTSDVTLSGTAAQINAALDGLSYQPASGAAVTRPPSFSIQASDGTTAGVSGTNVLLAGFFQGESILYLVGQTNVSGERSNDSLSIQYADSQHISVDFNGFAHAFNSSSIQAVTFNGNGGPDTSVVFGAMGASNIALNPGFGLVSPTTSGAIDINLSNSQNNYVYADGGTAQLFGGAGTNFASITADYSSYYGSNYVNFVSGVSTLYVYAASSADGAYIYSSPGDSVVETPAYSYLSAGGAFLAADGFAALTAFSGAGDIAYLYGLGSTYVSTPTDTYIAGGGYFNSAVNFPQTYAFGTSSDTASFYDSAGGALFVGTGTYSYTSGPGFFNVGEGYGSVYATSSSGDDTAYLYDSPGSNAFVGDGDSAVLSSSGGQLSAVGFADVVAVQSQGSNDTKHVGAIDYALSFIGDWTSV